MEFTSPPVGLQKDDDENTSGLHARVELPVCQECVEVPEESIPPASRVVIPSDVIGDECSFPSSQ